MVRWKVVIGLGLLVLLISTGCGESKFVRMYEDSYSAYMADDLDKAELSLKKFDEYLENKEISASNKETYDHYLESRIITNVRLYDIYKYKNDSESAQYRVQIIEDLSSEGRSMKEEDIIELINTVQQDDHYRPKWKK